MGRALEKLKQQALSRQCRVKDELEKVASNVPVDTIVKLIQQELGKLSVSVNVATARFHFNAFKLKTVSKPQIAVKNKALTFMTRAPSQKPKNKDSTPASVRLISTSFPNTSVL